MSTLNSIMQYIDSLTDGASNEDYKEVLQDVQSEIEIRLEALENDFCDD